jgi:hypothetical protein
MSEKNSDQEVQTPDLEDNSGPTQDLADYDTATFANQNFTLQFGLEELGNSQKEYANAQYINPINLVVHAELTRIYGDSEKRLDLQSDIEANGIIVPLVVSTRESINTIVSGACRFRCAIALNMESIPVVYYEFSSLEAEKHFILSANRNRPKTKYQQILEGKEWELLEKEAAALRRREGLSQRWKDSDSGDFDENHEYYPETLLPDYRSASQDAHQSLNKKQRATDKVGDRIGMSASSYERGKRIIEKCEKLRSLDKEVEAVSLESYLESAGIVPTSDLLKSPNCDAVMDLVGQGEAKTIKEALTMLGRVNRVSAITPGAVFFFPDKMLRKPTYFHLGRVVKIASMTATVCFRDSADYDLHDHQYKCDELLRLTREEDELAQSQLRDRLLHLLSHPSATPVDRHILNWLLGAAVTIPDEVDYLKIIESRVAGVRHQVEVAK